MKDNFSEYPSEKYDDRNEKSIVVNSYLRETVAHALIMFTIYHAAACLDE